MQTMVMDNRRQNYRHAFPADELLPVAVQRSTGGPFWKGWALDLSVTGMRIRLGDSAPLLTIDDRVILRFELAGGHERLLMHGEVVHHHVDSEGGIYGMQFLPSLSGHADEHRDRLIWQFLLAEQRRAIKRIHGEATS